MPLIWVLTILRQLFDCCAGKSVLRVRKHIRYPYQPYLETSKPIYCWLLLQYTFIAFRWCYSMCMPQGPRTLDRREWAVVEASRFGVHHPSRVSWFNEVTWVRNNKTGEMMRPRHSSAPEKICLGPVVRLPSVAFHLRARPLVVRRAHAGGYEKVHGACRTSAEGDLRPHRMCGENSQGGALALLRSISGGGVYLHDSSASCCPHVSR